MKKRVLMLLLTGCMTIGTFFAGCGSLDSAKETVAALNAEKQDQIEEDEKEEKEESAGPVLGSKDAEGYEGFEYLYEEILMTETEENEDNGKMEKQEITVFIPKGDYTSADRDRAYSERLGVEFQVDLNPYIQYKQEDYTSEENLQVYLENEFDEFYITDYKDFEMTEAEAVKGDDALATVKYCKYDDWEDEYRVYYTTFYLREISPKMMILVEVKIGNQGISGKTQNLLNEISAFYQFDVDWDKKEAEEKLKKYLESGKSDSNEHSTGYFKFELPEGWERDNDNSTYDIEVYAPDGDIDNAKCGIAFIKQYAGQDSGISQLIDDTDYFEQMMEEMCSEQIDNFTVTDYGDTVIGKTVLLTFSYSEDNEVTYCEMYLSEQDGYLYGIQVLEFEPCEESPFTIAVDILENGKLR